MYQNPNSWMQGFESWYLGILISSLTLLPLNPAFLQTAQPDCERQQPGQSHRVPQRVEVAFSFHTPTKYTSPTWKIHLTAASQYNHNSNVLLVNYLDYEGSQVHQMTNGSCPLAQMLILGR